MIPYVLFGDKNPLRSSGGRTVLHTLANDLKLKGYGAVIETDPDTVRRLFGDKFIAVYTDRISGNPLNASKIVRYMLHKKDYFDKKPREYAKEELIFRHSSMLPYDCPVLHLPITPKDFGQYYQNNADRNCTIFYEGKYSIHPYYPSLIERIDGLEWKEIKRNEPVDRGKLAGFLSRAKYFYCLDTFTILRLEAVLCGAITVLFENSDFSKEDYEGSEYGLDGCIWVKHNDSVTEQLRIQTPAAEKSMEGARQKLYYAYGAYGPALENFIMRSQEL